MSNTAKTEKTLGPRTTIYEGARRYKPGSPESKWPERFRDSKLTKLESKDHGALRDKMFKGKLDPPFKAEATGTTGSQPTLKAGSSASAPGSD